MFNSYFKNMCLSEFSSQYCDHHKCPSIDISCVNISHKVSVNINAELLFQELFVFCFSESHSQLDGKSKFPLVYILNMLLDRKVDSLIVVGICCQSQNSSLKGLVHYSSRAS